MINTETLPAEIRYLMFLAIGFYFGFVTRWLIMTIREAKEGPSVKLKGMGMKNGKEW